MVPAIHEDNTNQGNLMIRTRSVLSKSFHFSAAKKKPDQNWSQVGRRGSGAKYNLEDLWSPSGEITVCLFSILVHF